MVLSKLETVSSLKIRFFIDLLKAANVTPSMSCILRGSCACIATVADIALGTLLVYSNFLKMFLLLKGIKVCKSKGTSLLSTGKSITKILLDSLSSVITKLWLGQTLLTSSHMSFKYCPKV